MSRVVLIPAAAFNLYQHKRLAKLAAIGPIVRLDRWLAARGVTQVIRHHASKTWVALHPFRPGIVDVGEGEAEHGELARAGERLGWSQDEARVDLAGLTLRAVHDFAAIQNPWELERFLERVAARPPRTLLEIGTSAGGLLFALAQVAAPDATIISVDLPERGDTAPVAAAVTSVLAAAMRPAQRVHLIRDRSTFHAVRAQVVAALAGWPLDLLVIDGDHSYGGVLADVEMYAGLTGADGLVALHDVLVRPENSGRGHDVGLYWDELVRRHPDAELIADPDGVPGLTQQRDVPPAQRRPAALGWGLIRSSRAASG